MSYDFTKKVVYIHHWGDPQGSFLTVILARNFIYGGEIFSLVSSLLAQRYTLKPLLHREHLHTYSEHWWGLHFKASYFFRFILKNFIDNFPIILLKNVLRLGPTIPFHWLSWLQHFGRRGKISCSCGCKILEQTVI